MMDYHRVENIAWELFEKDGHIGEYLFYRAVSNVEDEPSC